MVGWGAILALVLSLAAVYVMFSLLKRVIPILLNGIFGIIVFWALAYFKVLNVPVDLLTFFIAAIGGVIGVIIIIVLSFLGVPL